MLQQAETATIPRYADEAIDMSVFTAYPIPLMTRIDMVDRTAVPPTSFSVGELSELFGVSDKRIKAMLEVVGATAENGFDVGGPLPGYIAPVIQTELRWEDQYNELPAYISTSVAAKLMDRARVTVKRFAAEHDYKPERVGLNQAVYLHMYPKSMLLEMRAKVMEVAAPEGSMTLDHLMQVSGMGRTWVVNHLREAGYDYEERWDEVAKRRCRHYPDEAADYLLEVKKSLPSKVPENWVNARQLRDRLIRGEDWVNARLKQYEVFALELLDSRNRPFMYYPPHVYEELSRLSAEERDLAPIGENLTIPEAMKATGYRRALLRNVLEILRITPERRANSDGRIFDTLNAEMIQAVKDFDMQQHLRDSLKQAIKSYGEGHVEASIQIDQLRAELRELERTQEVERQVQIQSDLAASKALARSFARRRLDAMRKLEELESAS